MENPHRASAVLDTTRAADVARLPSPTKPPAGAWISQLKIAAGKTLLLAVSVGLDQAHFVRKLIQRVLERRTIGLIFGKI
jgi:hypothetical protein